MEPKENTGYFKVLTGHGRSLSREKTHGIYKGADVANTAAQSIFQEQCRAYGADDSDIMSTSGDLFFANAIVGLGAGMISVYVSNVMPEEMKHADLVVELKELGVDNTESLSLEQMRDKFGELVCPEHTKRRQKYLEFEKEASETVKQFKCDVCGVPGGIKTQKEMLIKFVLPGDEIRYHIHCAKEHKLILSSTDARKFVGPTLFKKSEEKLPWARGPSTGYGDTRFFRVVDLNELLLSNGKEKKAVSEKIKKPKMQRGWVFVEPQSKRNRM